MFGIRGHDVTRENADTEHALNPGAKMLPKAARMNANRMVGSPGNFSLETSCSQTGCISRALLPRAVRKVSWLRPRLVGMVSKVPGPRKLRRRQHHSGEHWPNYRVDYCRRFCRDHCRPHRDLGEGRFWPLDELPGWQSRRVAWRRGQ